MKSLMGAVFAVCVAAAGQASAQETLSVSWVKGFYKSEDDALYETIKKFEQKTGVKVELSQYPVQDMIPKTVASLDSGTPPDVAYADVYDFQVTGKWAFEGRLEDITDIIEPIKDRFAPNTVETTYLLNEKTGKRAYYAYPIKQQTMHIEYWIDMLNQAGLQESDVPKTWKEYWSFWCSKVQPAYRKASGQRAYGIGQPLGVDSSDSFYSFLTFADAYNVKMVDDDGKLLIDDPKVKQGLVGALTDYTEPYTKGCVPPSATSWKDPDNNVAFHNKTVVLTHNATISIAAKWLDDMNNETLNAEQRAQAKKNYYELIRTAGFPQKPDGSKMVYRAAVKTGVIFSNSRNKARAQGIREVPAGGGEPDPLRRRLSRPLVPRHQGRSGAPVLESRSAPAVGLQPVQGRHRDLRVHQELQVHDPEQRERLGQGRQPRDQREGAGR